MDFIVGNLRLAVEAKGSYRTNTRHLKALRLLKQENTGVSRRIVVCLDTKAWRTDDGIEVMSATDFVRHLWSGDLLPENGANSASPAAPVSE